MGLLSLESVNDMLTVCIQRDLAEWYQMVVVDADVVFCASYGQRNVRRRCRGSDLDDIVNRSKIVFKSLRRERKEIEDLEMKILSLITRY